jgi:hypothetical protein
MPITPYLSGEPFQPETLRNMSEAFETVCDKLGLIIKHVPATELVAKFIVELAQTGVQDVESLLAAALERFSPDVD